VCTGLFRVDLDRNLACTSAFVWPAVSTAPGLGVGAADCGGVEEVVAGAVGAEGPGTRWSRRSASYPWSIRGLKSGSSHCLTTSKPCSLNSPPT
jgi:hypothetical protein